MLSILKKRSYSTGIEVKERSANILVLEKHKETYRVIEGLSCQATDTATALSNALGQASIPIKSAVISVPYSAIMLKTITLDASLMQYEILNYLNMNMEKLTGKSAKDIHLDFKVIGNNIKQPNKFDIRLVIAKRELIEANITLMKNANIAVTAIDVDAFALVRPVLSQGQYNDKTIAFVYISNDSVLLCIVRHNNIIYVKETTAGATIAKTSQKIHAELQMFFTIHDEVISQILVAGNISDIADHATNISTTTHIKTIAINPLHNMDIARTLNKKWLYKAAPDMMLSCGLALWKYYEH